VRERTERTRTGFPGVRGRDPKGTSETSYATTRPTRSSSSLSPPFSLMASLARLRCRLPLKQVGRFSVSKQLEFVSVMALTLPSSLLPVHCRPRPTLHNSPNHYQRMALRHFPSGFMKTLSGHTTPNPLPLTSRLPKTASSKCTMRWSPCAAWNSLLMRYTRASLSVASATLRLARCALPLSLRGLSRLTYHSPPVFCFLGSRLSRP
jgi:hypothetical protein